MTIPKQLQPLLSLLARMRAGAHADPARDWIVLLSVSAALLIASVAWNIVFFLTVVQGVSTAGVAQEGVAPMNDPLVEAQAMFEERSVEVERYRSGYRFVDPS